MTGGCVGAASGAGIRFWKAGRSWSRVDTRAYPKVAISFSSFESDFRINKASENSRVKKNYSFLRKDKMVPAPRQPIVAATPGGQDAAMSRTELWIVRAGLLLSPGRAPIGGSIQLSYGHARGDPSSPNARADWQAQWRPCGPGHQYPREFDR